VRASAGHSEPFGLKYLGVGNEDEISPIFKERFKMIYEAIKTRHPEIIVIGTVGPFPDGEDFKKGWTFAKELQVGMVDEHYYVSPQWFWDNQARYDAYDRKSAHVYVGEYAAHDRDRRNNSLRSAIAEAAGLCSFERNGDVVELASYAPLLSREGHTQWHPDMIYFTGTDVCLTPNYYVQCLFGQNSGNRYIDTTVTPLAKPATLTASTVRDSKSGELIVKIVNGASTVASMTVQITTGNEGELKATKTVLTGPSSECYNAIGQTPMVAPVSSDITMKPVFEYEAPANSLTVFRIRK
jgi:alpha-L-arabinofuranosidase